MQLYCIIFELDSRVDVNSVNANGEYTSRNRGNYIQECRNILSLELNFLVKFVRKLANVIINTLNILG